jgi:hypothetical protein
MKRILTVILVAATVVSCKKENVNQPPAEFPRQLITIENSGAPAPLRTFSYDAKGRVSHIEHPYESTAMDYTNNVFSMVIHYNTTGNTAKILNGKLDNDGRILEYDGLYQVAGFPDAHFANKLFYNAEGYVVKHTNTNLGTGNTSQDEFIYTKGNLTSDINTFNGQPNYHLEYTYYDSLPNKLNMDIIPTVLQFMTDGLTGKRSVNLVKRITNYHEPQHVIVTDYLYEYVLDAQGYPVKYKIKSLLQNFESEYVLNYNK